MHRQQQLLDRRGASNWSPLAVVISFAVSAFLHVVAALALIASVEAGQKLDSDRQGKIIVSTGFLQRVQLAEQTRNLGPNYTRIALEDYFADEAQYMADRDGAAAGLLETRLRRLVAGSGSVMLVPEDQASPGLATSAPLGPAAAMFGSLLLAWWFAMIVCQGEGLELDLQRRRHPMWEWQLGHPVSPGAVFLAEMLSPLAANPFLWSAPLFVGVVVGNGYGMIGGLAATFLLGVPVAITAGCLSKAVEINALLRLPPRSRGGVIGVVSWFGFASSFAMFFAWQFIERLVMASSSWIGPFTHIPWPFLGLALGMDGNGSLSFVRATLFCWAVCAVLIAVAIAFCANSIRQGLSGAFAADALPVHPSSGRKFERNPLLRKEILWFKRDSSAVVQVVLIPITLAAFQLINVRALVLHAGDAWNYLAGAAVVFGTYFLWVLGPKSLASEGTALWITLTWPLGLESMLKAKAKVWSNIATFMVVLILLAGCWMFPDQSWKIALVAIGWFLFARTMSQKAVTLVTVYSESGEPQTVSSARRWAAQLGMLSFAIGITTQQWNLAIVGLVYAWITAAAMWEDLRSRLPYLYDPWSEVMPRPPTLVHAMVAIGIMVELTSILAGVVFAINGSENLGLAMLVGYATAAILVTIGVWIFLNDRGLAPGEVFFWDIHNQPAALSEWGGWRSHLAHSLNWRWLLAGAGGGVTLGLVAYLYIELIKFIPGIEHLLSEAANEMDSQPSSLRYYAIAAIVFAPIAEEFLFRGMLYRSLDRHWGGWKAILASAAFFTVYHPPLTWVPVGLVGAANCLIFKRSGSLAPAIVLHMTYNVIAVFLI